MKRGGMNREITETEKRVFAKLQEDYPTILKLESNGTYSIIDRESDPSGCSKPLAINLNLEQAMATMKLQHSAYLKGKIDYKFGLELHRSGKGHTASGRIQQLAKRPDWYWSLIHIRTNMESAEQSLLKQEPVRAYREITKALKDFPKVWDELVSRCLECDGVFGEHFNVCSKFDK